MASSITAGLSAGLANFLPLPILLLLFFKLDDRGASLPVSLLHYKPPMISFHESYGGTLQALDFLDIEFAARFFCSVVDMIALFLVICWVVNHLKLGVIGVVPES